MVEHDRNKYAFILLLSILHFISLFILCYLLTIKSMIASTNTLHSHLMQSGVYGDLANIIKARISENFPPQLQDRIIATSLSERFLDAVITPEFVARFGQPILAAGVKIASQPLEIQNNHVTVDTTQYKEKAQAEINSRELPDQVIEVAQNTVTAIPDTLTLVNPQERQNSILAFLARSKFLFERINTSTYITLAATGITLFGIVMLAKKNLAILFKTLTIIYIGVSALVLAMSFIVPELLPSLSVSGQTAQSAIHISSMINHAMSYVFESTRMFALILLIAGVAFYLLNRKYKFAE